jgi:hypothetical protein
MEGINPDSSLAKPTASFSAIGKRISISRGKRNIFFQATLIDHNQTTGEHVIKFDRDGREETVALNRESFKWITQPSIAADVQKQQGLRKRRADDDQNQALVGRSFEYTTSQGKKKNYEILSYDRQTGKHGVRCDKSSKTKVIDVNELANLSWLDTIAILPRATRRNTHLRSSKYIGVIHSRRIENRWIANAPLKKGGSRKKHIGTFNSEKNAALAHDCYARKIGCNMINFENESISEEEVAERKMLQPNSLRNPPVKGRSKYRGVHWQKNRKRWMARYSQCTNGKKHINLGAFLDARHAALAFDHEARKQDRKREILNFPDETVSVDQIREWSTNVAHYRYMRSGTSKSSQYRGVTNPDYGDVISPNPWKAQVNIKKVLRGLGKKTGPFQIGAYPSENQAALAFDRICRRFGIDEIGLNFPRNIPLPEIRLFDTSCYYCNREKAINPVVTKCNHVFCRACIMQYLLEVEGCPCCQTHMKACDKGIRPVKLNVWPTEGIIRSGVAECVSASRLYTDGNNGDERHIDGSANVQAQISGIPSTANDVTSDAGERTDLYYDNESIDEASVNIDASLEADSSNQYKSNTADSIGNESSSKNEVGSRINPIFVTMYSSDSNDDNKKHSGAANDPIPIDDDEDEDSSIDL